VRTVGTLFMPQVQSIKQALLMLVAQRCFRSETNYLVL